MTAEDNAVAIIESAIIYASKYDDLIEWRNWLHNQLIEVERKIEFCCPDCEGEGCRNCNKTGLIE